MECNFSIDPKRWFFLFQVRLQAERILQFFELTQRWHARKGIVSKVSRVKKFDLDAFKTFRIPEKKHWF